MMTDKCMICLELCNIYIKLSSCKCKNICHEECFKEYIQMTDNDSCKYIKYMKCMICKKKTDLESSIKMICSQPFINSFLYSLYFLFQNFYFYIEEKIFKEDTRFLRIIFAISFHLILTTLFIFPYLFVIYLNYIIFIYCRKPYRIYNL